MTSQWVLSVSQLNEYVRKSLSSDPVLRMVRVRGEISGFKRHYSGHMYFSVKDEQSRVQCVMFRNNALTLDFEPRDGMTVVLSGQASLYTATGSFQVYCESIEREGMGELYARFEALKKKLADEGLFDAARKKVPPFLPGCVGIVTSRTAAALRDMVRVISRRYPGMKILFCHASVQGQTAAGEIAAALDALNATGQVDVILCGRGGGSIEELWAFNEETVARAIARSRVPVISCVGHEVDFTIADFVADVRAATPSVAAELAVPVLGELARSLISMTDRLYRAQSGAVEMSKAKLRACRASIAAPARTLIEPKRAMTRALQARLLAAMRARLDRASSELRACEMTYETLDPYSILKRGYAFLSNARGAVKSAGELIPGMKIDIKLRGGTALGIIEEVNLEANDGG
ncbi:MAG: exodeoxyribonuclease VII large subunit [Clostridia bacterium]|nr:exodeoxyribonuclease VII large subunit [Clostridia bacterium]